MGSEAVGPFDDRDGHISTGEAARGIVVAKHFEHGVLGSDGEWLRQHGILSFVEAEVEESRAGGPAKHLELCREVVGRPVRRIENRDGRKLAHDDGRGEALHLAAIVADMAEHVVFVRRLGVLEPARVGVVIENKRAKLLLLCIGLPVLVWIAHKAVVRNEGDLERPQLLDTKVIEIAQERVVIVIRVDLGLIDRRNARHD